MAKSHPSFTVDTTFSNKDIRTAASVYTFTASADARVSFTVKLTNAAGNGDYIIYLKRQWLGTGTASVIIPKATCAAASGETVIEFVSLAVDVKNTDVIDVYIDGLAGDSAVSGNIRIVADNPSVFEATDTVSLVSAVTGLTASNLDATVSSRLASASYSAPPASSAIADAVWDEALSGHTTAGTAGKALSDAGAAGDPWSASVRTLTQTAAQVSSAISGTTINVYRDATVTFTLTGLTDFTGYSRIWFTAKEDLDNQPDSAAILHLMKSTTDLDQTGDGLVYLNGASATLSDGSITVNSATSITVTVKASAAASLPLRNGIAYGAKALVGTTVLPVSEGGSLNILATAARAIA